MSFISPRARQLFGATALGLVLSSGMAQAQVTPEQVWTDWQTLLGSGAMTLTSTSATRDGDTLVVQGLTFSSDDGAGTTMTGSIDRLAFKDNGDGTVGITMADSYPVKMTFPPATGQTAPGAVSLRVSQPGLAMTAKGAPGQTAYDFTAPTMNIKVDSIEGAEVRDLVLDMTMTGMTGGYTLAAGATTSDFTSTFKAASASFVMSGQDVQSGDVVKITASLGDMSGSSAGSFLPAAQMADMVAALKAGFSTNGAFAYGATAFDLDVTEGGKPTRITGTATGGDFTFAMNKDVLSYGSSMMGAKFSASGGDIPFPKLDISYGEGSFGLKMPIAQSDTPQEFSFLTRIVDLVLPAEVWAMGDPTGALPRDPATVVIDAKGTANWFFDIMDEAKQKEFEGKVPGQIHSLQIDALQARAVGAEVTGTGSFTFDNADLVTWDGLPAPTGTMNLTVKGANALIDKLIAMGLVSQDDAMGARMMIAMIAKPGEGEDVLNSTLEFKDKGFFANGQRLR